MDAMTSATRVLGRASEGFDRLVRSEANYRAVMVVDLFGAAAFLVLGFRTPISVAARIGAIFAGAAIVLMEAMPAAVARRVTEAVCVPTIGIGAGPHVSGQVLVNYDILDIYPGRKARFVKNFLAGRSSVKEAIAAYVKEVKDGTYPGAEHSF